MGLQSTAERTTPLRTWPVPVFARIGGSPCPNGPNPSSGVALQVAAAGTPPAENAASAAAASSATTASRRIALQVPRWRLLGCELAELLDRVPVARRADGAETVRDQRRELRALEPVGVPAVDLLAVHDRVLGAEIALERLELRGLRLVGEEGDDVARRVLHGLGDRVLLDHPAELRGRAHEDARLEPELRDHQVLELALQ